MNQLSLNVVSKSRERDHGLTSREYEVLERLVQGDTNSNIAQMLGISTYTVMCHVKKILRHFGAENRTQAAIRAVVSGEVSLSIPETLKDSTTDYG